MGREIQCPLDIVTLDIVAMLPLATSTPMDLDRLSLKPAALSIATLTPLLEASHYIQWVL